MIDGGTKEAGGVIEALRVLLKEVILELIEEGALVIDLDALKWHVRQPTPPDVDDRSPALRRLME